MLISKMDFFDGNICTKIYKRFHYNIQACRDLVPLVGMVGEEVTIFLAELRFVVQIRPGQPGSQIRFRPPRNTGFGSVP